MSAHKKASVEPPSELKRQVAEKFGTNPRSRAD
jgi:hypothetical protein